MFYQKSSPYFYSIIVFIGILFGNIQSQSQNLISDPGFEEYLQIPTNTGMGEQCLKYWKNPNRGHFDYYHQSSTGFKSGIPLNYFGKRNAHSGNAYSGICIMTDYAEYVWTKLSSPLGKNKTYCVSFYISKSSVKADYVNEFGVLFTEKDRFDISNVSLNDLNIRLTHIPQIEFTHKPGYTESDEWTCLSKLYKAKGNENYLTIGYFTNDRKTPIDAHYYIDDVSVSLASENNNCSCISGYIAISNTNSNNIHVDTTKTTIHQLTTEEIIFPVKNILFDIDQSIIKPEFYKGLDALVVFMIKHTNIEIEITGHTDNTGDVDYNLALSKNRAEAVARYLINKNIQSQRIKTMGYGITKPITENNSPEGKAKNRRVEILLIKK